MIRHIVLFRIHDWVAEEDVERAIAELRSLGSLRFVYSWRIERSTDGRKGRVIVEDAEFVTTTDFAEFRADPSHRAAAQTMSQIADWLNGDYVA